MGLGDAAWVWPSMASMAGMDDATGGTGTWTWRAAGSRAAGVSDGGARRLLGGLDLAAAENQVREINATEFELRSSGRRRDGMGRGRGGTKSARAVWIGGGGIAREGSWDRR